MFLLLLFYDRNFLKYKYVLIKIIEKTLFNKKFLNLIKILKI